MKKIFTAIAAMLAITACGGNATGTVDLQQLMDVVSFRYITFDNEQADAQAVEQHYDSVFTAAGYTRGLTGDGYGGPCSIIDGYYTGGHVDTTQLCFVPDQPAHALVIELAACNDGDDDDYGYPTVSLNLYHPDAVKALLEQVKKHGFVLTYTDNDDDIGISNTYELTGEGGKRWTLIHYQSKTINHFSLSLE